MVLSSVPTEQVRRLRVASASDQSWLTCVRPRRGTLRRGRYEWWPGSSILEMAVIASTAMAANTIASTA